MNTAKITGTDQTYPIGKILCIGRNYVDHIKELGNEPPGRPVVFMKPATSVIGEGEAIVIPPYSNDCHYETELALLIGKKGKDISVAEALGYLAGYAVAIDLTLRDVQAELKKKGLPWDIAKGFDTACPLSDFIAVDKIKDPQDLRIRLTVNNELRQDASTALMIHTVREIISYLSTIFTLEPGDVILTGTPVGVGQVKSGDRLSAEIDGVSRLQVLVK